MVIKAKTKGSWGLRFFIVVLGVILGVLFYWLLSFVESDIGTVAAPDQQVVRREFVPESYDTQKQELAKESESLNRKIRTLTEQQQLLSSSTSNLQSTINQLLDIQRESLNKNVEFPEKSRNILQESQMVFLQNQQEYQRYNKEIAELTAERQQKEEQLAELNEKISQHEKDANEAFYKLMEKHRLKVAAIKLAFLVPVFIVLSFVFMRYRTSAYWPLVWAAFIAAFLKITLVVHEYFPSRYFKYIAIVVVLGIVLRILVYLIRLLIAPKRDLLLRQYRQDYDKCQCPVCGKPIRTGMLRYVGCLKKRNILISEEAGRRTMEQEPYTCPSCGTTLYDKCDGCSGVRHSLLPYCEHCGKEKELTTTER